MQTENVSFAERGWGANHVCILSHRVNANVFLSEDEDFCLLAKRADGVVQKRINSDSFYLGPFILPNNASHYVDPREHPPYLSWNPPREIWEILISGNRPLFSFIPSGERIPSGFMVYCDLDGFPNSCVQDLLGVRIGTKGGDVQEWVNLQRHDCLVNTKGSSLYQDVEVVQSQKGKGDGESVFIQLSRRLDFVRALANNMQALKRDLSFPFKDYYDLEKLVETIGHLPREHTPGTFFVNKEKDKYRVTIKCENGDYKEFHTPLEVAIIGAINVTKIFDCIPVLLEDDICLPREEECYAYLEQMEDHPIESNLPQTQEESEAVENYHEAYKLMRRFSLKEKQQSYERALQLLNQAIEQKQDSPPLHLRRAQVLHFLGNKQAGGQDLDTYERLVDCQLSRFA